MNILSLAHFFAFMIYVWMIVFVLIKNPKAKLNIVCALLIFSCIIWTFGSIYFQSTDSKNDAFFWANITSFGWCSFPAFYLWFSFIFSNKDKILKKWYFYFILSLPLIFIFQQWKGYLVNDFVKQVYVLPKIWIITGWASLWSKSIWILFYNIYYLSFIIISLIVNHNIIYKTKLIHKKKQAKAIISTTLIALVLCTIVDILLPQLKIYIIPPIGGILTLIWAGGIVYAITKYRLMILTSSYAANDILTTMSDSLILIDPEGKIVEVNKATLNLLGYKKNEIIGNYVDILFTKGDILFIKKNLFEKNQHKEILNDRTVINHRIKYITKNKKEIPIDFSATIMKEKSGDIIGIVCIARDIREIIKAEKQKEKLDSLKNDFIANITHDFRSPLTVILNISDLELKTDKYDKESFKSIYNAGIRLKNSIDRLLEIAKMDALGIKLNIQKVNPILFLQRVIAFYSSSVLGSGIKIVQKFKDKKISNFYTDIEKLEEIIDNIISNAIKFVDPNEGRITIDLLNKKESIAIIIEDNGIGIPKEKLDIIFNRFEQAHEGRNSKYKGTGIGLAFARQLVGFLKGNIWAESEGEDKGSKFFVELKKGKNIFDEKEFLNEKEEREIRRKYYYSDIKEIIQSEIDKKLKKNEIIKIFKELNKENEYDYKKGLILIVDDDRIISEIVMRYLMNDGYKNFILAPDGKLALDTVFEYIPDIIICDYNMPNMRGDIFHNELIDNPKYKEIPIIFLSAIADRNIMVERKEKGAGAYLKKPIDEEDLLLTVDFHIKKYFEYLKVSQLATIDELTGLNNRRAIISNLKHELSIRKYRDLSLIFFDIDHFKEINDTHGHQVGDKILINIGEIIKKSIRNYDIPGRYGGDEFIIILIDTNIEQASYVAEILRNKIEKNRFRNQEEDIYISASFGVTSLKDNAGYIEKTLKIDNLKNIYEIKNINEVDWNKIEEFKFQISEVLLKMADMSLYRAKQTSCKKCNFTSEKLSDFNYNICSKCKSSDLITGRNKVYVFE